MIRFSIIIPVYNTAGFFNEVLDSIPADIEPDLEILLVDDHSTDSTAQIIRSHAIFPRLRFFQTEQNSGPATARNLGASNALGEFLIFFDADVLFLPDTFKKIKHYIQANPEVSCFTGINSKDSAVPGLVSQFHSLYSYYALNLIPENAAASTWNPRLGFIRKDLFWLIGGFDTRYRKADVEDYAFSKMIEKRTRIRFTRNLEVKHRFGDFWQTTKSFYKRSRLWAHLFFKTRSVDRTGHTRLSNFFNLIISFLIAVCLFLVFFFPMGWPLAVLLAAHGAVNFRLFSFFIGESGIFCALIYFFLVLYYNWVAEIGVIFGIFDSFFLALTGSTKRTSA